MGAPIWVVVVSYRADGEFGEIEKWEQFDDHARAVEFYDIHREECAETVLLFQASRVDRGVF